MERERTLLPARLRALRWARRLPPAPPAAAALAASALAASAAAAVAAAAALAVAAAAAAAAALAVGRGGCQRGENVTCPQDLRKKKEGRRKK